MLDERKSAELREQFIAVLGHDLRNPLASIDAGVRMLRKTPLDEKALQIVGLMQSSVARMAGLVDDVLDFARGRLGGGLPMNRDARAPMEPVLSQVVAELRASWADRVIDAQFSLPHPVNCDPRPGGAAVLQPLGQRIDLWCGGRAGPCAGDDRRQEL